VRGVTPVLDVAFERARTAAELILSAAARIEPAWLMAGVALHLLAQVVRCRGWWTILRVAYPGCRSLRVRDVTAAYFAGAGLNGLLPARAGDIVKYAYLHRRIAGSRYATLVGSSVAETTFEIVCGAGLIGWMIVRGFVPAPLAPGEMPAPDVSWYMSDPAPAILVTAGVLVAAVLLFTFLRRRSAVMLRHLARGLAVLTSPRSYVQSVVTWQALSRLIRLGAMGCFLTAFALPATPCTALLVMAAQGGGRIIPLAPVSAGVRIAMLSYGLVEVTNEAIDPAAVTAFTFGVSAVLFVVMLAISLTLAGRELQTRSPRKALRRARARLAPSGRLPSPNATAPSPRASQA
jgi:Lysylphosphatidylglycerol synthase TM region